jgi:hypothetical protein
MGIRGHPAESLAAYFPWLAREWHPTRNQMRTDQVTRASGRGVIWRWANGHEWAAARPESARRHLPDPARHDRGPKRIPIAAIEASPEFEGLAVLIEYGLG